MRVALDLRALEEPGPAERGIGRYVAELARALPAAGVEVVGLQELARPPSPGRVAELWDHALLRRDARAVRADVLHTPSLDHATVRPGLPYVVTLHDLAPLKRPDLYVRSGLKHRLRYAAVRRATRVIVPSRAVADEAGRLLGLTRVDVVAEAPPTDFAPVPAPRGLLARLRLPDRFLLWVGGLDPPDPRKGIEALAAHVAAGAAPPLVLAGRYDAAGARLGVPQRVILTGRVSDAELAALYSAADVLLLPSEDEGFGLTPHEALACGTPVAAFAIPALAEALGDHPAVRLVPPGNLDALLAAAAALGGRQAPPPARTWADVARETAAVYERALAAVGPATRQR